MAFEGKNGKKWEKIIMGWGAFFFSQKTKTKKRKRDKS